MEIINWSSFFLIPHCLRNRTIDLNLVKNPSMESKQIGHNEINSSPIDVLLSHIVLQRETQVCSILGMELSNHQDEKEYQDK